MKVSVLVCRERVLYPETPPEIKIFKRKVTIPAGDCAFLRVNSGPRTFRGDNMLRVVIEGDTAKDAKAIVATLSGRTADGRLAPSMVVKHRDFIEAK
ncbi:hypothetical protein [Bacillus sp. FJAT-44742]|uniref:hypothetical protein n=1 Tax=Bacillus sp. FJAT-44742 TaxID=2014005 RepID=UPI0012FEF3C6|nr:hypothetical protein [Bacillus sp. FJAT-44742]